MGDNGADGHVAVFWCGKFQPHLEGAIVNYLEPGYTQLSGSGASDAGRHGWKLMLLNYTQHEFQQVGGVNELAPISQQDLFVFA